MNGQHSSRILLGDQRTLDRRALLGKMIGAGAVAVAAVALGGAAPMNAQQAAAVTQYKTTTALNLRSGAGTSFGVIAVMPVGTIVAHTGTKSNGFLEVGYNGTYGWAHGDYLTPVSGNPGGSPVVIGTGITTAWVNFRSGPGTGHSVIRVLSVGTVVNITGTVQNGFRQVVYQNQAGWIASTYLSVDVPGETPYDPNYATTTAALNLRAEPSTSARVLLVMPSGSRVKVLEGYSNGFRKVSYNGTVGWAYTAYLN
jgi:uncharacterized protein YraI